MVCTPKPINDEQKEVESKINSFEQKYSIGEYKDNANQYRRLKSGKNVFECRQHTMALL